LCPNHFLDTSILLGSRISWDAQFSHVSSYISITDIQRISSKRAYNEAKGVLQRNRREILQYLDTLKNEFSNPGHPIINDAEVDRLSQKYCSTIENEKSCNALTRFSQKNIYDITKALQDGNTLFDQYKLTIGRAFQTALNSLAIDCRTPEGAFIRRYDICPQVYDRIYDTEQYRLMTLINYIEDVKILLDSYFLQDRILEENLFFVTTDTTHILRHKNDIEGILIGMSVSHPQEYHTAS
jgi:hypothetical protein